MDPMIFPTPDGLELDVRVPAGTITLRASETIETRVHLTGERDSEEVTIRLTPRPTGGHHLIIEHKPGRSLAWFGSPKQVRVKIDVPLGTAIAAESGSADLAVVGEIGALSFRSGSGDLAFGEVRGGVDVKVASGDIRGESAGADLRVQSASGDVRVRRVGGISTVKTASGDIEIESAEGSVQVMTTSGDVTIGTASAGQINIRTISGDVGVGVAPDTRVWLDLESRSGATISELKAAEAGDKARLEIRAVSVSGDVRVTRSSVGSPC